MNLRGKLIQIINKSYGSFDDSFSSKLDKFCYQLELRSESSAKRVKGIFDGSIKSINSSDKHFRRHLSMTTGLDPDYFLQTNSSDFYHVMNLESPRDRLMTLVDFENLKKILSPGTLRHYVKGQTDITNDDYRSVCNVFNLDFEYIMKGKKSDKNSEKTETDVDAIDYINNIKLILKILSSEYIPIYITRSASIISVCMKDLIPLYSSEKCVLKYAQYSEDLNSTLCYYLYFSKDELKIKLIIVDKDSLENKFSDTILTIPMCVIMNIQGSNIRKLINEKKKEFDLLKNELSKRLNEFYVNLCNSLSDESKRYINI